MIVVDTQATIWVTQNPSRLTAVTQRALIDGRRRGELAIADITLREVAFLVARGRIAVSTPLEGVPCILESRFAFCQLDVRIAARSVRFGSGYPNDPADMLIGATAVVHDAALVTADTAIRASGEVNCVW